MEEELSFSVEEVRKCVGEFLGYVGYELKEQEYIGFVKPEIHAERRVKESEENKRYELVGVVRRGLEAGKEGVIAGLRDLCAAKCVLGEGSDYVLIMPPTSERLLIAFLIEEEDWYFPIKDQNLMIWLVNPQKETVNSIIGWPADESFRDYFENPNVSVFDALIGRKAAQKIMAEEEEF